jgi:hypothetical protein
MYKVAILVPAIRPQNWARLYDSCHGVDFEMIFVGPNDNPEVTSKPNVKFIFDMGNPARAMNIALIHSRAEYIHWEADDAHFLEGQPEQALKEAEDVYATGDKVIVTSKYLEGPSTDGVADSYYRIKNSINCHGLYINPDNYILNTGFIHSRLVKDIGGWDGFHFHTMFFSHLDLACRLQNLGYKFVLSSQPVAHCDHMPHITGDHAPIHYAHIEHDEPNFKKMYGNPEVLERTSIDIHNWRFAAAIWKRRYGNLLEAKD